MNAQDRPPTRGARRGVALGLKRMLDMLLAAFGLFVLSPLLAWVAVALLATQGRPILFRHERPGLHGYSFTMIKFRTMREPRPGEARYHSDHARLTRLGHFLRSTSIDELPELWNVLRGEMSLVGPRPLLAEYLDVYSPEERRRHAMRPGITSWAAVNGRHVSKWHERLAMDVWYVDHWSLGLDARIIAMTLDQVLRRRDVSATQDISGIGFPLPSATDPPGSPSASRRDTGGRIRSPEEMSDGGGT